MNRYVGLAVASIVSMGGLGGAMAADLPMKAAPMMPTPVYNWTGFYIGGNAGGGWDIFKATEIAPGSAAFPGGTVFAPVHASGWLAGVQAGYNYQVDRHFVVGVEGEYSWADIKGTATTASIPLAFLGIASTTTDKMKDFALFTGRIGYAEGSWLFYVKGGGAWTEGSSSTLSTTAGVLTATLGSGSSHTGYVVGVGAEWGFAPNWSAKIESDHIGLDSRTIAIVSPTLATTFVSSGQNIDMVRAGVNYRFNWGMGAPLVAKY
jgi:outer membrane immunogenic protein